MIKSNELNKFLINLESQVYKGCTTYGKRQDI